MRTVCSWGGGKDSCLAWARTSDADTPMPLVSMVVGDADLAARAYRAGLQRQADALGTSIETVWVSWSNYADRFAATLADLDADRAVFGTIDVDEHRTWVESTCNAVGVRPEFPLWGEDPTELYRSVVERGYEARIVKLDVRRIDERWLGEPLDDAFLEFLMANDLHPLGEHGSYQTLVVDGPGFATRVPVRLDGSIAMGEYRIARLEFGAAGEG